MAWITTEEVKAVMETTSTEHDTVIGLLIPYVEQAFKTFTNYNPESEDITEKFYINNTDTIVLGKTPVTEVTSITIGSTTLSSSNYVVDKRAGIVTFADAQTGLVTVEYTAGHTTIPSDIKNACILQVIDLLQKKERLGLKSLGKQGETTSYSDIPWLPQFIDVCNKYYNPVMLREEP